MLAPAGVKYIDVNNLKVAFNVFFYILLDKI